MVLMSDLSLVSSDDLAKELGRRSNACGTPMLLIIVNPETDRTDYHFGGSRCDVLGRIVHAQMMCENAIANIDVSVEGEEE